MGPITANILLVIRKYATEKRNVALNGTTFWTLIAAKDAATLAHFAPSNIGRGWIRKYAILSRD